MADDLVQQHDNGLKLLERIDAEYYRARAGTAWTDGPEMRQNLIGQWGAQATEWIKETAARLRSDSLALGRFRGAQALPVVPHGANIEWAGIHGTMEAKLEALRQIIDSRRRSAAGISIGAAGAVNFGTVFGEVRGTVVLLEQSGQRELARLLSEVVARLPAAKLSEPEKDDAAHLTQTLAEEASKRGTGRLSAVGRATATALGQILTRSADLAQIWQAIEPYLK